VRVRSRRDPETESWTESGGHGPLARVYHARGTSDLTVRGRLPPVACSWERPTCSSLRRINPVSIDFRLDRRPPCVRMGALVHVSLITNENSETVVKPSYHTHKLLLWVSIAFAIGGAAPAAAFPTSPGLEMLMGLPTDIYFVSGVTESKSIPLRLYTTGAFDGTCHDNTHIRSTHASVDIVGPCYPDTGPPGEHGCSDPQFVSGFDSLSGPLIRNFDLELVYDGGASAGEMATIDFMMQTDCSEVMEPEFEVSGTINVHIVAPTFTPVSETFQVVSTSANVTSNWVEFSHPMTDGRHDAVLLVTPVANYGSAYSGRSIGVWYSGSSQKWNIYNELGAGVPHQLGVRYNVTFLGYSGQRAFVHKATSANTTGHITTLSDPRLDGNPYARAFVTHNWNPPGESPNYFPTHVGLWFDKSAKRWKIYSEDFSPIPAGKTFNVAVAAAYLPTAVGLWPLNSEAPTSDAEASRVHFTHVWQNPLGASPGTYLDERVCSWRTVFCHPWAGCSDQSVPGTAPSGASSLYFSRWVPDGPS